jgi:uncharacterized protein YjbI with pentapeptide repeats
VASKKQLRDRWKQGVGLAISSRVNSLISTGSLVGTQELFDLKDLPFKDEVENGRDLRGIHLEGGVRSLDLRACDFTFSSLEVNFIECDLSEAVFNEASIRGIISNMLTNASFTKASLKGADLSQSSAHRCTFDEADLTGAIFDESDLYESSFVRAKCKRSSFFRANIARCSFQGALLEEAVLSGAKLNKDTDFRGASLVNVYDGEHRDRAGRLVAPGVNWRDATYDAGTTYGSDPRRQSLELVDAAIEITEMQREPQANWLRGELMETRERLNKRFERDWYDELLRKASASDRPFIHDVFRDAARSLL